MSKKSDNKIVDFFTTDLNVFNYVCNNCEEIVCFNTHYVLPSPGEEELDAYCLYNLKFKNLKRILDSCVSWHTEYEIRDSMTGEILDLKKISKDYGQINYYKGEAWLSA